MSDSQTPDEIADEIRHNTRDQAIKDLASSLDPENGYETDEENGAAEVFSLLCEVTRLYTRMINKDRDVTEQDQAFTLQSVLENVAPSFDVTRTA